MLDQVKNFIKFTVPAGYNTSATAITLASADIAKFPRPPFNLVWCNSTDFATPEDDSEVEIIRVTATASTSITATRAQEGTAARNHNLYAKSYKMMNTWTMAQVTATDNAITTLSANLSGHTGTHTFPGSGSTTHTVVVSNGLVTNWTEA